MFLLVTPAYNEADNVAGLVDAVRRSTLQPDLWVVVNDRSTDETEARFLAEAGDLPLRVVPSGTTGGYMGFRYSEVIRAGIAAASDRIDELTLFGILDCDIRFAPDYWANLAARLEADPKLGIVSGSLCAPDETGQMRMESGQRIDLPRGGLRLATGDCFRAVDGFERSRAPDSVMTVRAKCAGWTTKLLEDQIAWSVRPTDSRGEDESGWESRGRRAWNVGQPSWQVHLRALGIAVKGRADAAKSMLAGYRDERDEGEQLPDPVVQRYYRHDRPREWFRSIRRKATFRDDPHRYLQGRVMAAGELPPEATRPTPS